MEFDSTGMALNNEQVICSRFPQRLRMMRSAQQTRAPFAQVLMTHISFNRTTRSLYFSSEAA